MTFRTPIEPARRGGSIRRVLLKDVPRPPHLDFRDQHDEALRCGAGVTFQWLLRARLPVKKISCAARRHSVSPAQRKQIFELCSGSAFCVQKRGLVGSPGVPSVNVPRPEKAPGEPGTPAGAACKPARHACRPTRSQACCPTCTRCSARGTASRRR